MVHYYTLLVHLYKFAIFDDTIISTWQKKGQKRTNLRYSSARRPLSDSAISTSIFSHAKSRAGTTSDTPSQEGPKYVHHAERDVLNKSVDRQLQDITQNGIQEANLLAEKLKDLNINITAIYTSPYLRCKHTTEIINKYQQAPIYEENRFNEMNSSETWKEFSIRNMQGIDSIIKKHNDDDFIICVSSGVNLSAFIYYFNNIEPKNESPKMQALTTSPVLFSTNNKVL